MKWQYKAGTLILALLAAAALAADAAGEMIEQKSVLGGKVLSLIKAGTPVMEGQVLATVETIAGPVPAAKAAADGVVKEVKVQEGDTIERNTVLLLLEKQ